jgi:para-nitrobenzyl esterase
MFSLSAAAANPQAHVTQGMLEGTQEGAVAAYLGVPFAAPPVGNLRWRPPAAVAPWTGTRKADAFAASCFQGVAPGGFGPWTAEYVVSGRISEDCLYLNVWTPANAQSEKLPVLFWIHGGGFMGGSGSVPIYDGAALAAQGIVVVDVNYRLGAFGFLAHPELTAESPDHASGNYGLLDVVAALRWVNENIAAFGGDPKSIAIAGQSAGAALVLDLDASPLANGLYARAIAESGAGLNLPSADLKSAEQAGLGFAGKRGAKSIAALRAMPPEQILGNPMEFALRFAPIADGWSLPEAPSALEAAGSVHDTPFLTGLTADEASGMNPKYGAMSDRECADDIAKTMGPGADRFRALYLGPAMSCNEGAKQLSRDRGLAATYLWAEQRAAHGRAPLYLYLYDHTEPGPQSAHYGAFHSSEIPYVFRTLDKSPDRPFSADDHAISDKVSRYWLNFIRTGDPNGASLPEWPAFEPEKKVMELGDTFHARPATGDAKLKAFDDYTKAGGTLGLF